MDDAARATALDLALVLGHAFRDLGLLEQALAHPSLGARHGAGSPYERLEFLGDRVLGLVMAEWLFTLFPAAKEGELAKRHAALVGQEALHKIAAQIHLERYLRLAHGEVPGQGRKNLVALSDAVEAVLGALYLDAGLEKAGAFIKAHWLELIHADAAPPIEPKTALQEWAQGHGLPLPAYDVMAREGPAHAPVFRVSVRVEGFAPVEAVGPSKRQAEKEAAQILLESIAKSARNSH